MRSERTKLEGLGMSKMAEFDKNFLLQTKIERQNITFYSADDEHMSLHGIWYENGKFRRMPEKVAETVSKGVFYGHALTAGGRLRFVTDSDFLAISVQYGSVENASTFPVAATAGFDLYEKIDGQQVHLGTFAPPMNVGERFESEKLLSVKREHELTLVFPLYSGVRQLYVGIADTAILRPAPAYKTEVPIVFYGSSITHGACASRPGNTYISMASREMDFDYVSLGFGGNAKAEQEMADYIAGLDMSIFVLDYDYNAPNLEYLEETHERMYRTVRQKNPTLPIVIMSRPKLLTKVEEKRFNIVKATYDKAVAAGDQYVYFVPGYELIPEHVMESAKVDCIHPNDLGFYFMSKRVQQELAKILPVK